MDKQTQEISKHLEASLQVLRDNGLSGEASEERFRETARAFLDKKESERLQRPNLYALEETYKGPLQAKGLSAKEATDAIADAFRKAAGVCGRPTSIRDSLIGAVAVGMFEFGVLNIPPDVGGKILPWEVSVPLALISAAAMGTLIYYMLDRHPPLHSFQHGKNGFRPGAEGSEKVASLAADYLIEKYGIEKRPLFNPRGSVAQLEK